MDVPKEIPPINPPSILFAPFSIQRLIYLILVAISAISIHFFFPHPESYWIIWTALLFSIITFGDTFKARLYGIGLTTVCVAISSALASILVISYPILGLYLFILITGGMLLSQMMPRYFLMILITLLFTILSVMPGLPIHYVSYRFFDILVGGVIAIVFQGIFYWRYLQHEWQWICAVTLRELITLNNEIFSCFLTQHYPANIYIYEKRLHVQKSKYLKAMTRLRRITELTVAEVEFPQSDKLVLMQNKLDDCFDLLLNSAELRRRVSDYATFSICEIELAHIRNELDSIFAGLIALMLGREWTLDISRLQGRIHQLEGIYNNVLTVSSREPLVFLLYIFSLKTLSDELVDCEDIFRW